MHKADLKHGNSSLQGKLNHIFDLRKDRARVNWSPENYLNLLEKFGNPHKSLPPVIHVAGTNGKGSIIAILRAILEAQGLRVHIYTSPHLINVNERIVLAGVDIGDEYLEELIDQALEYNGYAPISFFEVLSAIGFKAFADNPADILLLEVGLGGRLDCTNIVENPLATIINRISMDHMDYLGNAIEGIAAEKAGVMKLKVPCVVGYQGNSGNYAAIIDVLKGAAKTSGADLLLCGNEWNIAQQNDGVVFSYGGDSYEFPLPSLKGEHQIKNAGVALAVLFSIRDKLKVSYEAMAEGLKTASWAGRLQKLTELDYDAEIWLDSGHNDSAGEVLAAQLKLWQAQDDRPLHLIVGMLSSKEADAFLAPLLPHIAALHIVPISSDPNSQVMGDINADIGFMYEHDNFLDALQYITKNTSLSRILIAGSVYLAGEVLAYVQSR